MEPFEPPWIHPCCAGYQSDTDGKCYILAVTRSIWDFSINDCPLLSDSQAYISGEALMLVLQLLHVYS